MVNPLYIYVSLAAASLGGLVAVSHERWDHWPKSAEQVVGKVETAAPVQPNSGLAGSNRIAPSGRRTGRIRRPLRPSSARGGSLPEPAQTAATPVAPAPLTGRRWGPRRSHPWHKNPSSSRSSRCSHSRAKSAKSRGPGGGREALVRHRPGRSGGPGGWSPGAPSRAGRSTWKINKARPRGRPSQMSAANGVWVTKEPISPGSKRDHHRGAARARSPAADFGIRRSMWWSPESPGQAGLGGAERGVAPGPRSSNRPR